MVRWLLLRLVKKMGSRWSLPSVPEDHLGVSGGYGRRGRGSVAGKQGS